MTRRRAFLSRLSTRACGRCCGLHGSAWAGKRLATGFVPMHVLAGARAGSLVPVQAAA